MYRSILTVSFALFSSAAIAHVGHIEPRSGHDHYLTIGAAVLVIAIAIGAAIWSKRSNDV